MSISVMTQVWQHSQQKGGDLLALLALADNADDNGVSYPSIDYIARKTRMSRRNTIYVLHRLEKTGELTIDENAGPHGTNKYQINLEKYGGGAKIAPGAKIAQVQTARPVLHTNRQESSSPSSALKKERQSPPKGDTRPRVKNILPEPFEISEKMRAWAQTRSPSLNLERDHEVFCDKARARDWKYKDWEAAWRNYMSDPYKFDSKPSLLRVQGGSNGNQPSAASTCNHYNTLILYDTAHYRCDKCKKYFSHAEADAIREAFFQQALASSQN